jgi:hypothetical protein
MTMYDKYEPVRTVAISGIRSSHKGQFFCVFKDLHQTGRTVAQVTWGHS